MTSFAAPADTRPPPQVRLRPTLPSDLDYVLGLEHDPRNLPFITPWEPMQHEAAIRFPDFRHYIIEAGDTPRPAGFVIFLGCNNRHQSVELKRMVVQEKSGGIGRAALRMVKRTAFDDLGAHRFWLDVKQSNTRAQGFYTSEGFTVEGVLRESVKLDSGFFDSLVLMSMLRHDFEGRRARGVELPA